MSGSNGSTEVAYDEEFIQRLRAFRDIVVKDAAREALRKHAFKRATNLTKPDDAHGGPG